MTINPQSNFVGDCLKAYQSPTDLSRTLVDRALNSSGDELRDLAIALALELSATRLLLMHGKD